MGIVYEDVVRIALQKSTTWEGSPLQHPGGCLQASFHHKQGFCFSFLSFLLVVVVVVVVVVVEVVAVVVVVVVVVLTLNN